MNRLRLLGPPQLETPSVLFTPDRRMAGVWAYLALEGATHKYRLAGLLWPDAEEATARSNMRQLLRRVRVSGGDIVAGEDLIELRPEVEVDVKRFSYLETPSLELLRQDVELLAGLEFDDTYDFADWLTGAREELRELRARAARNEAERLEGGGQHRAALEFAQVWARLEPLSEEAHRLLMRLHYLLGDRGAALAALERLRLRLREELGAEPLPNTLELARMVERGEMAGAKPKHKESLLSVTILRPPVLAGREREWALMEQAWQEGKMIALSGEPGSGKTRLAEDFAASKGRSVRDGGRPGDPGIPFATLTRNLRAVLERHPELSPTSGHFEPWVWRELAHLLPEVGEGLSAPPTGDKLRLFEAASQLYGYGTVGLDVVITDDIQFLDDSTHEAGGYHQLKSLPSRPGAARHIVVFRRGELSEVGQRGADLLLDSGQAVLIEVEPLGADAIGAMLGGMGIASPERLVPGLARYTGGNPLFILETVKHLIETEAIDEGLPPRLSPPGKVAALVGRRMGRLSPAALNLARCAAVAKTSFGLSLAASVLERPAMELAEAHAELEEAQILRGNAFTHDLVFEAVLSAIPTAVGQVLHHRTAQCLEAAKAPPALIAQHWEAADDGDKTAQWLTKAAQEATGLGLYTEAVGLLERAVRAAASKEPRLTAQVVLADALGPLNRAEESIGLAKDVLAETDDPHLRQRALGVLQNMYQGTGRYAEAEVYIAQALELAEQLGEPDRADAMRFYQARILRLRGRYVEAAGLLEAVLPAYRKGPAPADLIQVLAMLGNTYNLLGRHDEADPLLEEAEWKSREAVGPALRILALSSLLYGLVCRGHPEGLLAECEAALEPGGYAIADGLRVNLGLAYLSLARPAEAARHYQVLAPNSFDPNYRCMAWARLAALSEEPAPTLERAMELHPQAQTPAARFTLAQAALLHGNAEQKSWAAGELKALSRDTLPWLFQTDYDRLLKGT